METTIEKVVIGDYNNYQEAFNDMKKQGVRHLGWINDGIFVPDNLQVEKAFTNWTGSSTLYVDRVRRIAYSVDMGD